MKWIESESHEGSEMATFILSSAKTALEKAGIQVPHSPWDRAGAVMIAEAINLAAKVVDEDFYDMKSAVIDAAERFFSAFF